MEVFESHAQHLAILMAKRLKMLSALKCGIFFNRAMQAIYTTYVQEKLRQYLHTNMPFICNVTISKWNYKRSRQKQSKSPSQELNTILSIHIWEKILPKHQSFKWRAVKAGKSLGVQLNIDRNKSMTPLVLPMSSDKASGHVSRSWSHFQRSLVP